MKLNALFLSMVLSTSFSASAQVAPRVGGDGPGNLYNSNVSNYISAMKLLGGDGSITLNSAWKKGKAKSSELIGEVRQLMSQYGTDFDYKILESKTNIETQDVCESWKVYKDKEIKENHTKTQVNKSSSFRLALGLAGSADVAGIAAADSEDSDRMAAAGAGAAVDMNFGIGFKSNVFKTRDEVNYYYVSNSLSCAKTNRYSRAVLKLTPDIFTLHSQQTAKLIFSNLSGQLDAVKNHLRTTKDVLNHISDSPVYSEEVFLESFKSFESVKLYKSSLIDEDVALTQLKNEFKNNIQSLQNSINSLKSNSIIKNDFADDLELIQSEFKDIVDMISSFEKGIIMIEVNHKLVNLMEKNQITLLRGTSLQNPILNASYFERREEKAFDAVLSSLVLPTKDELENHNPLNEWLRNNPLSEENAIALKGLGFQESRINSVTIYTIMNIFERGCIHSHIKVNEDRTFLCAPLRLLSHTISSIKKALP